MKQTCPKMVWEKGDITILCDMPIQTDREIAANHPDIVVKNILDKTCTLVDLAIPSDKNTSIRVQKSNLNIEIWK